MFQKWWGTYDVLSGTWDVSTGTQYKVLCNPDDLGKVLWNEISSDITLVFRTDYLFTANGFRMKFYREKKNRTRVSRSSGDRESIFDTEPSSPSFLRPFLGNKNVSNAEAGYKQKIKTESSSTSSTEQLNSVTAAAPLALAKPKNKRSIISESASSTSTPQTTEFLFINNITEKNMDDEFEDLFANFSDNYFELYEKSNRDDFSDVRQAVLFDREMIQLTGHQRNDFIVQCSFDNKNCHDNAFSEFEDPMYGKCFTFYPWREVLFP